MKTLWMVVAVVLFAIPVMAEDNVPQHLQEISVTIKSGLVQGSGIIRTVEIDGKSVNFVLTAAHVVDDLRSVKEVIDPKMGTKRQIVKFKDCALVQELIEDGRRVGEVKMDCSIIRYSEKEDLCVLRVRKKNFLAASVEFYMGDEIPKVGTELYHCGSPGGQALGANSLTPGIMSQIGRMIDGQSYDQTTCMAIGGSSGGIVALKENGQLIGVLTRGITGSDNFNYIVPVRRIRKWAESAGILWLVDNNAKLPTEAELKKLPVEDIGESFDHSAEALARFPFLIVDLQSQ